MMLSCYKTERSAGALAEIKNDVQVYMCCSNSAAVLMLDKVKLFTFLPWSLSLEQLAPKTSAILSWRREPAEYMLVAIAVLDKVNQVRSHGTTGKQIWSEQWRTWVSYITAKWYKILENLYQLTRMMLKGCSEACLTHVALRAVYIKQSSTMEPYRLLFTMPYHYSQPSENRPISSPMSLQEQNRK